MHPAVGYPAEDDFVWYVKVDDETQGCALFSCEN